ncbi:YfjI family protein [Lelliottia wanjuensis]|uniref:YfjI family protein n=1 Tax=Lelliottia wanjuensis TaxID=3050585 RepID=UPI00254A25A0|nr:YfjI family protein [Lelliottia sp. V86_10]MDK9584652.1 YfjI family protein [Lelliottia sp. V86_10]
MCAMKTNGHIKYPGRIACGDYPVDDLPEELYQVAIEIQKLTQAPFEMIVSCILSVLSLAAQGAYDVKAFESQGTIPLSLFIITLALSGERKTTVEKLLMRVFREYDSKAAEQYQLDLQNYQILSDIWKTEKKALESALKAAVKGGKEPQEFRDRLEAHGHKKPNEPVKRQLIYDNTTERALLEGLRGSGASAGLMSDEGGNLLKSNIFSNLPTINKFWSGGEAPVNRMKDCFIVKNARLTMHMMVQPDLFLSSEKLTEHFFRESGAGARFLLSYPVSTMGERYESSYSLTLAECTELQKLEVKLQAWLEESLNCNGERQVLVVGDMHYLTGLHNLVERELNYGHTLYDFSDVGSKIIENTVRIAGTLHLLTRKDNSLIIPRECIDSAHALCGWYVNQFMSIFSENARDEHDEALVMDWLDKYHTDPRWQAGFPVSDVANFGPSALRNKDKRIHRALENIVAKSNGTFMFVEAPRKTPGRPGVKYFVSNSQFNDYWKRS